jgi:Tfp pilus assembly protein PilF
VKKFFFEKAIELDPNYAKAYHLRGLAFEKTGDIEAAIRDFDRAIEINPEYGAAYYSRATAHSKLGHVEEAAEDVQMVTHLTEVEIEEFANADSFLN